MPHKAFLGAQLGEETTWGTAVTPTVKLMNTDPMGIQMSPTVNAEIENYLTGSFHPGASALMRDAMGAATIPFKLTYDDSPYWLDGMFGKATPSGADPYTYAYAGPGSSLARRIFTFVYGDGSNAYGLAGGLATGLQLSAQPNESVMGSVSLVGQKIVPDAIAALSDRDTTIVEANDLAVYIDAWGGTVGTTQLDPVAQGFTLNLNLAAVLSSFLGHIHPQSYTDVPVDPTQNTLELVLQYPGAGSETSTIVDAIVAATPATVQRQIRLVANPDANHQFQLDFAGTVLSAPQLFTDRDGITTATIQFGATYNSTLGNWLAAEIINQVATLA